jgi:septum formation protein
MVKAFHPLIVASTSAARRQMLERAGLMVHFRAPNLDEDILRWANSDLDGRGMAQFLADAKASSIITPNSIVIGADQTLELNGKLLTKAKTLNGARHQLLALRGQTHYLHSAVACTRNGLLLYRYAETASMKMRNFSDDFLEDYLHKAGSQVLHSVGCYFYEAEGIQLFDQVEGDYYTILGMPLLPLLAFLRNAAMLAA